MRIGIPRAFYYHQYPRLWETFFRELGHEPIISGHTSRETVTISASVTEAEHCLPNKIFDGHVEALRTEVDAIFIPRVISMVKGHIACPKFGALPEASRDGVARDIRVLSVEINETKRSLKKSLLELARNLEIRGKRAQNAAKTALDAMRTEEAALLKELHGRAGAAWKDSRVQPRFLILGHPYTLFDTFIADPIFRKLKALKVYAEPVTFEDRSFSAKDILWCTFRKMHERLLSLDLNQYTGVIQISTFNCGADSMMIEKFRRLCIRKSIPYMVIMVDEHAGTAGIDTRLEAFVDSLAWKAAQNG